MPIILKEKLTSSKTFLEPKMLNMYKNAKYNFCSEQNKIGVGKSCKVDTCNNHNWTAIITIEESKNTRNFTPYTCYKPNIIEQMTTTIRKTNI